MVFSCGFQLAFITAHFPAFIAESSSPIIQGSVISLVCSSVEGLGALSIALIGLFNIIGCLIAGALGKDYSKIPLALIYAGRTIAAILFIILPITPMSVAIFSIVMGSLWLATVPLNCRINWLYIWFKIYGNIIWDCIFITSNWFFCWCVVGVLFYDIYGSYDVVWWVGIGVGAFSAIIHLPVKEMPLTERRLLTNFKADCLNNRCINNKKLWTKKK